jgi:hypothetical protein
MRVLKHLADKHPDIILLLVWFIVLGLLVVFVS